jgi:hypothetical protein
LARRLTSSLSLIHHRGVELLIDAISLALNDQVRIFASLLADAAVRYPAAFAVTWAMTGS